MKSRIILLITTIWLGGLSSVFAEVQGIVSVANIAELQSLPIAKVEALENTTTNASQTNLTVHVLGYYNPGDRGGGTFEWSQNESATPDAGLYIATNGWSSGNGRWVRRLAGEVPNIKMWGAKGDIGGGVESLSNMTAAHDDTTNIQNAINAISGIQTSGGWLPGELLIPAGWYKVSDTLILSELLRLRGETVRMTHLVMSYGVNKDILHTLGAQQAISANDGHDHWDGPDRIEDISFEFAPNSSTGSFAGAGQNQTNAAIVMCEPDEGSTIRNVSLVSGGYGIRCFGGGGGIDAPFRDIVCEDNAIAGLSIEPVPGATACAGQVSITGISGDHRRDESRSNACLVKFVSYGGPAYIEGINAEGIYGGGIIHHDFSSAFSLYDLGNLTIKNGYLNDGNSYGNLDAPHAFVVLGNSGIRTTALTLENIHVFNCTNLIRDELSPRDVPAPDATSEGLRQAVVRLPLAYEAVNSGYTYPDGVTVGKWSRLTVGGQAIYSFTPTTTNAWYRILSGVNAFLSSKATITSFAESSEFSVNVLSVTDANAVELNVTRTMKANTWPYAPCATKVRAGSYSDGSGNPYPFTDIYVERALNLTGGSDLNLITVAVPVYDYPNVSAGSGHSILQTPTVAPSSGAPAGCTLMKCVTNSLVR
jgi:hypothetical protein